MKEELIKYIKEMADLNNDGELNSKDLITLGLYLLQLLKSKKDEEK